MENVGKGNLDIEVFLFLFFLSFLLNLKTRSQARKSLDQRKYFKIKENSKIKNDFCKLNKNLLKLFT